MPSPGDRAGTTTARHSTHELWVLESRLHQLHGLLPLGWSRANRMHRRAPLDSPIRTAGASLRYLSNASMSSTCGSNQHNPDDGVQDHQKKLGFGKRTHGHTPQQASHQNPDKVRRQGSSNTASTCVFIDENKSSNSFHVNYDDTRPNRKFPSGIRR